MVERLTWLAGTIDPDIEQRVLEATQIELLRDSGTAANRDFGAGLEHILKISRLKMLKLFGLNAVLLNMARRHFNTVELKGIAGLSLAGQSAQQRSER